MFVVGFILFYVIYTCGLLNLCNYMQRFFTSLQINAPVFLQKRFIHDFVFVSEHFSKVKINRERERERNLFATKT